MPRRWAVHATVMLVAIATGRASAQPLALTRQDVGSYPGARGLVSRGLRPRWLAGSRAGEHRPQHGDDPDQPALDSARSFVAAYDVAVGLGPIRPGDRGLQSRRRPRSWRSAMPTRTRFPFFAARRRAASFATTSPRRPARAASRPPTSTGTAAPISLVTGWNASALQVLYGTGSGAFTNGPALSGLATHPAGRGRRRLQPRRASRRRPWRARARRA